MRRDGRVLARVMDEARKTVARGEHVTRAWQLDAHTAVLEFLVAGRRVAMDIRIDGSASLTLVGRSEKISRHLRNVLVGKGTLVHDPQEKHVLHRWRRPAPAREIVRTALGWITWLTEEAATVPNEFSPDLPLPADHVSAYWWDERSNFGDAVGPWLVQRMTGKSVVNGRRVSATAPTLLTVGSIIGYLDRGDVEIWGSGLIKPLEGRRLDVLRSLPDVTVHAVRGELTRADLEGKLGWEVPQVYGDPALLLPRFYRPRPCPAAEGKVAFLPHAKHAEHFAGHTSPEVHRVDVRHSLEQVIDEIAASTACVSSSLHGIILAQAYGVPWTWLRIKDDPLNGDRFKFEDFFTGIDEARVSSKKVGISELAGLDVSSVGAAATLPGALRSLDPLLDAFPLPRALAVTAHAPPGLDARGTRVLAGRARLDRPSVRLRRRQRGLVTEPSPLYNEQVTTDA